MKTSCLMCVVFVSISGCKDSSSWHETRQTIAVKGCKEALLISKAPTYSKVFAQKVLDDFSNETLDPCPVLIHAGYITTDQGACYLALDMSDEDQDVMGVAIREVTEGRNGKSELLEKYPVFVMYEIGHFQLVAFERRTSDQRKDEDAWSQYVSGAVGEHKPPVWVSAPAPPGVAISVWVYDAAGHRSNEVPLERGLLRELATEQEMAAISEIYQEN